MPLNLTAEEARVLGSLIEKDMATPEYYPLSLNALVNACNQKSNRDPMVNYTDDVVRGALQLLQERRLLSTLKSDRVPKYGHRAPETLNLNNRELALVCVLLLRGPQTLAELKTRTERMYDFGDLDAVENCLNRLGERDMAVQLPKLPGTREPRWMHLLSGEVDIAAIESGAHVAAAPSASEGLADRVAKLEMEVVELRAELESLRKQGLGR
jgi:uncharacterized protein YceH (UPF0502 family)